MSHFNKAILHVLGNEGGYVNDKNDKGGATNLGISTRFLKLVDEDIDGDGHVTNKDVESLTKDRAVGLYKEYFWDHYKLESIRDVHIATKALDMFVNMRGKSAGRILQKACNLCGAELKVDGIAGKNTFNTLNKLSMFSGDKAQLLEAIRHEQAEHYKAIVKADKSQKKFLKGWLNRAKK